MFFDLTLSTKSNLQILLIFLSSWSLSTLVLAALVSNGKSYINRIYHLDRGYEKIENKLKKIGIKIKRLK